VFKFERQNSLLWASCISFAIATLVLSGGKEAWPAIWQTTLAIVILCLALGRLYWTDFPSRMGAFGVMICCIALALPLIQLISIPPSLWTQFPGRDLVVQNFEIFNQNLPWMPTTLSPHKTESSAVWLLTGVAIFLAAMATPPKHVWVYASTIVVVAILSAFFGMAQRIPGFVDWLDIGKSKGIVASSIFADRNHFAALLYSAIPFVGALALSLKDKSRVPSPLIILLAYVFIGVLLAGLAVAASRTGLLLAVAALTVTSFSLGIGFFGGQSKVRSGGFAVGTVLVGFLLVGQASIFAFLRFAAASPIDDYRKVTNSLSLDALWKYFPVGSGFGSFVPVYQQQETPPVLIEYWVNHTHNDWIELVVEGGLPVLLCLLLFIVWLVVNALRVWRNKSKSTLSYVQKAAIFSILFLLIHSALEYPLRTTALMTLFCLCCGITTLPELRTKRPIRIANLNDAVAANQTAFRKMGQAKNQ
jgi:O-Antigen ligase